MEVTSTSSQEAIRPLYEQDELSVVTGGTLRPGGIALTTEILSLCQPAPGSTVLDVGCGPGHTVALMASVFGLRPTGLDPSAILLAKAAQLMSGVSKATFLQGEATAIPCQPHSFDMVIAECVLSLTGDIEKSLREMYRVLRPGGMLILTDIYCMQVERKPELPNLKSCISHALPLEDIKKGLSRAGLSLVTLQDRSNLLKQLAGQIIFSYGSLEKFWQLFMGADAARMTCRSLATAPLGYYVLIAEKGENNG